MSTEAQDPDEIFAEITSGLDIEDPVVEDLTKWSQFDLARRFNNIKDQLHRMSRKTGHPELVTPSCEESRALHSEYYAIWYEMKRRTSGE